MKLRVVLDTNQLVSALLSKRGVQAKLLDAWRDGLFEMVTSHFLISELQKVLTYPRIKEKYHLTSDRIEAFLKLIADFALIVPGDTSLQVIMEDPADDRVLACAVESGAHFIVSGDSHLLALKSYQGIPIVTGRAFLDYLK